MRHLKVLLLLLIGIALPAFADGIPITIYKNPNCGCCNVYADYLRRNGFEVKEINTTDMVAVNEKFGVPSDLEGCHVATAGGYAFGGLIPADLINRVLKEHKPIKGITLPGMPTGAPGMPGAKSGPLDVYYISNASPPRKFSSF